MRTIDWETASQVVLRNCSKEVRGKVRVIYDFNEGVTYIKHTFWQRLASQEEQMSLLMTLVLF